MELNSFYNLYENNWVTNIGLMLSATAVAFVLAYLLPFFDNLICTKIGLNLQGGVSKGRRARLYYLLRKGILLFFLLVYLVILVSLVIFARNPNPEYRVRNAGISLFKMILQGVVIPDTEYIEFYLNVMLFIPMGYLLPYIFRWFRIHAIRRPLLACLISSVIIENVQLVTKRGLYDTGDVIANTLGGAIGLFLFIMRAYTLTNPYWKKDYRNYRRWRKLAKNGALFPFVRKVNVRRVAIQAIDEEGIWDFYAKKLGFQLVRFIVPPDSKECSFLFQVGKTQIEINCTNNKSDVLPKQVITLSFENIDLIKDRLVKANIGFEDFSYDEYTNHRKITIKAPENVDLVLLEL